MSSPCFWVKLGKGEVIADSEDELTVESGHCE